MTTYVPTSRADIEDQRWLDSRVDAIEDGIEAVIDIAVNWTDGRGLARLHPRTSAQDYILARVKHPLGRGVIVPLLSESNWSNRQIAAVAGVSRETVRRIATSTDVPVDRPAETLGADGKLRPARVVAVTTAEVIEPLPSAPAPEPVLAPEPALELLRLLAAVDAIAAIRSSAAADFLAAQVAHTARVRTAGALRRAQRFLGEVALSLEGN